MNKRFLMALLGGLLLAGCVADATDSEEVTESAEEILCGYNGCGVGGPKPKPTLADQEDGEEQTEKMPIVIPCAVGEVPDGPNPCDPDPAPQGAGGAASE